MELIFLNESDAESISEYIHDMWVDTYAPIIKGGRQHAEDIFDDWVGPGRIRKDMSMGHFYAYPVKDGRILGLMSAGKEGDELFISKVYIAPEHRGEGYGSEAVKLVLDYGRARACKRAVLEVNPKNENAKRFYSGLGFKKVGVREYESGAYTDLMVVAGRRPSVVKFILCGASSHRRPFRRPQ
ncbi:MAG: N-acetyltransferase [Thermoplasmata archaeon]|nr:N-acetyltransferase [Thermoplasmata archaeon]